MAQTAEAPNAGVRFFRWVLQRQTHQIQDELEICISVSTSFFNRLVSDFSEGRVSCVCISFVVMGGRSHTPGDHFLFPFLLAFPLSSSLFFCPR